MEEICCDTKKSPCFDQTYTRLECCGSMTQKRANNCAEMKKGPVLKAKKDENAQNGEDLSGAIQLGWNE